MVRKGRRPSLLPFPLLLQTEARVRLFISVCVSMHTQTATYRTPVAIMGCFGGARTVFLQQTNTTPLHTHTQAGFYCYYYLAPRATKRLLSRQNNMGEGQRQGGRQFAVFCSARRMHTRRHNTHTNTHTRETAMVSPPERRCCRLELAEDKPARGHFRLAKRFCALPRMHNTADTHVQPPRKV